MEKYFKVLVLMVLMVSFSSMQNDRKTRVVFFGDSITQAGAKEGGYIRMLEDMLKEKGVAAQYELIGAGIGGNKIYDLYLRMEEDVLAQNPDVVVIWVGVNDVWHKATSGTGTDPDKFLKFYRAVIKKLQDKNIKVYLVTPATIGEKTDNTNQQDGDLNKYSNFVRGLAAEHNCGLIDLRKEFMSHNLKNNPENKEQGILTTDRVHLNPTGNRFVAEKMLNALVSQKK